MPFPVFVAVSSSLAGATALAVWLVGHRWGWLAGAGVALAGATALLVFHGPGYFDFYADDAFITLRYSRHLADGLGPNWNAEGHVEGYTNFLWMAVFGGLGKLGIDQVDASRVLGGLAVVATFVCVFAVWKLWRDESDAHALRSPLLPAAAVVGLALIDGVAFWGFSGMETVLFMALLTAAGYLYFRECRGALLPWSAVALAAAAMTRPEGLVAAAVTGAFVLAAAVRAGDPLAALRRVLSWSAVFVFLYGSYFLWRYTYYDSLLPNTYYAKVGFTSAALDRGLGYVLRSGLQYHLLPLFAGLAALLASDRRGQDVAYIMAVSGALLLAVVLEGGDDFLHGRFIIPMLPLLLLGGLAGLGSVLERAALRPVQSAAVAGLALTLAGLSLLPASYDAPLPLDRQVLAERRLLGRWLNANTPTDYTIAAFAVGAISYYADDRAFLDLLGLNDTTIARTDVPGFGEGLAGHEKYNVDYVLDDVRPEIIVPSDGEPAPITTEQLQRLFSTPSPVKSRDALLTDPRLWEHYEVRSLNLEGRWFNFLQRRDTVAELRAPGLR